MPELHPLLPLFAILGALLIGAISPGPSFVYVVRTSVAQSRGDGLAGALGMGVGAAFYGALALAGLRTLMSEAGWLYVALKLAGGLYLIYLAVKIFRGAGDAVVVGKPAARRIISGGRSRSGSGRNCRTRKSSRCLERCLPRCCRPSRRCGWIWRCRR